MQETVQSPQNEPIFSTKTRREPSLKGVTVEAMICTLSNIKKVEWRQMPPTDRRVASGAKTPKKESSSKGDSDSD